MCGLVFGLLAAGAALVAGAQDMEMESFPSPAPLPSGPLVTLHLEIEQTELHPGDFLSLRVTAVNDTQHGMFGFVPVTTIRISTWPKGWRDQDIVDGDFIASRVLLLPEATRYVWGSAGAFWSAHAMQVTWEPGDYRLRYCTPILGKLICTNTVEIRVDQR